MFAANGSMYLTIYTTSSTAAAQTAFLKRAAPSPILRHGASPIQEPQSQA